MSTDLSRLAHLFGEKQSFSSIVRKGNGLPTKRHGVRIMKQTGTKIATGHSQMPKKPAVNITKPRTKRKPKIHIPDADIGGMNIADDPINHAKDPELDSPLSPSESEDDGTEITFDDPKDQVEYEKQKKEDQAERRARRKERNNERTKRNFERYNRRVAREEAKAKKEAQIAENKKKLKGMWGKKDEAPEEDKPPMDDEKQEQKGGPAPDSLSEQELTMGKDYWDTIVVPTLENGDSPFKKEAVGKSIKSQYSTFWHKTNSEKFPMSKPTALKGMNLSGVKYGDPIKGKDGNIWFAVPGKVSKEGPKSMTPQKKQQA